MLPSKRIKPCFVGGVFLSSGFLEKNNDLLYRNLKEVRTKKALKLPYLKQRCFAEDVFNLCIKQEHIFLLINVP